MFIETIRPPARSVLPAAIGFNNTVFVGPDDDLIAKYNWLKSSDRDAAMGALSSTNWRTLILSPGEYSTNADWVLDTDYVAVISLTGNPLDTVIVRGTGGETVKQTADIIALCGFTIRNTGTASGDHGFEIEATDNSDSYYSKMHFRGPTAPQPDYSPVKGTSSIGGLWVDCSADNCSWIMAENKELSATMIRCEAKTHSFGGDKDGVDCSGLFIECRGEEGCFSGCTTWGADCSGTFYRCVAGYGSYALTGEFSGIAIDCIGGSKCFGGSVYSSQQGKFTGYAENCIAAGGHSFGMGDASNKIQGIIINCRNGTRHEYRQGLISSGNRAVSDISTIEVQALVATEIAGVNNDLTFTTKATGSWNGAQGNKLSVAYSWGVAKTPTSASITSFGMGEKKTGLLDIRIGLEGSPITANEVKTLVDGSGAATHVSVAVTEGDGTGDVDVFSVIPFTGGISVALMIGNHPWQPTACTGDTTVWPFDNGHSYTNEGASGLITWSLPAAVRGMKYTFTRTDYDAGEDVRIDPNGIEHIYKLDGTDCGAGKWYGSDLNTDAFVRIVLECFKTGEWRAVEEVGTLASEA